MAKLVHEIMNRELFNVRPPEQAPDVLGFILALDITSAAVVDGDDRPIGLVSIRDLVRAGAGKTARECMTSPAATVPASAAIEAAARLLAESGRHRLVVVDEDGRAVGMVSAIDLVRGLLGMPPRHPATFPRFDRATGLVWTNDTPLLPEHALLAPEGAGILVLIHGGPAIPERPVWVEACSDLRRRIRQILFEPAALAALAGALNRGELRFRCASVADPAARQRAIEEVQGEAMAALHPTPPGAA